MRVRLVLGFVGWWALGMVPSVQGQPKAPAASPALKAAREKGLAWLSRHQEKNGSWGKTHTIAVTSFACLAFLSASDEPFIDERGKALFKGIEFLLSQQKDGMFGTQGHSWIHGQGFATLALSEAYGRSLFCKTKPDIDTKKIRQVVEKAVAIICKNQSHSGGWWYTPGAPFQHEGSTTVCTVQAIVSAHNFGIPIDEKVMDKGFEYLKKCQTPAGGFNYRLGDGSNMKEGTAAAVATLGLMQKFDFEVMLKGYNFLLKTTPGVIGQGNFPFYGHFYGTMGMHLLWQEYKVDKTFNAKTQGYIALVQKELLGWQNKDGSFQLKGWAAQNKENPGYSTAFALIALLVPEGRLSIHNREAPKLPGK